MKCKIVLEERHKSHKLNLVFSIFITGIPIRIIMIENLSMTLKYLYSDKHHIF